MDWTSGRTDRYEFWLLSAAGAELSKLDGITAGKVNENADTALKVSGSLSYAGAARGWLDQLVRVYLVSTDEFGETARVALGTFLTTTPKMKVNSANNEYSIDMYSRLLALQQNKSQTTVTYTAGTNIVSTVASIVTANGLTAVSTPSTATLVTDVVFEAGTDYLAICNALLEQVNYWSLDVDGLGNVLIRPYVAPSARPTAWTFNDDAHGIFLPDVDVEYDTFDTPNVVTVNASMPDLVLTSTATNSDPNSPYSTVSRGRNIVRVESVNSTPSQADLDATAARLLAEGTLSVESFVLKHAYAPFALNDVVAFNYIGAGIQRVLTVKSRDIELGNGALCNTTLKWVR